MKTRMFQHVIFLPVISILLYGCQSGPFARSSQLSDSFAQDSSEMKNESDIQKSLREAMAVERQKGQSERNRRNSQPDPSASLAELSTPNQNQNHLTRPTESKILPISSTEPAPLESNDTTVIRELNLAYDADRSGNIEKAQGYYQRVLTLDPENFGALHRLAIIEDKKNNFPTAEAYYLKALKLDPSNADLLSDIGYSYMLQGRDDYGEKYLHEALKYQPGHRRSLDHLGWYYGRMGQYDQALSLFRMTGGEAQAQLKFAQLFPGVEPNTTLAQGGVKSHNVQMVGPENTMGGIQTAGQFQTDYGQNIQHVGGGGSGQSSSHQMVNPAGNNPTLQIAEMMKRERDRAIQARGDQQLPSISPNQLMTKQVAGYPNQATRNVQDTPPLMVNPSETAPTSGAKAPQIQAWPPAGDPGIAQAVEASNYWASKAQQQQNQQQQIQNRTARPLSPSQIQQQMRRQQMAPANVPRAGQPMYGRQYQSPGQFPNYQINSTQSPPQQQRSHSENIPQNHEQQLVKEAARTGMNMGPGQMFPIADGKPNHPNSSPLMPSQIPTSNPIPSSAQVPQQNIYQTGGQSIRQVGTGQPTYQQQTSRGISQAGYEFSNQQTSQMNGFNSDTQNRNLGRIHEIPSSVPQSAMFSNNPAFAPANVRSHNLEPNQQIQRNGYGRGNRPTAVKRQPVLNHQGPNQQISSPVQWGAQQQASPYHFPAQQSQY
ncbi:Tetratricopeptide repeat protein [Gimesia aquarii]|uniref:Tetratricopeptide repeat protein n=2 Tax=Gimesia aquarii TaxID=2527964 RepID=A0A517W282_9PLAN|nr:Tetratricopeptide repeat protein [Gimesia aquarii]